MRDTQFKLAIAYNNGAIEYEFIGKIQLALEYFQNAFNISSELNGLNDDKTVMFKNRHDDLLYKSKGIKHNFITANTFEYQT